MGRSLYAHLARRYRAVEPASFRSDETDRAISLAQTINPLEVPELRSLAATGAAPLAKIAVVGAGFAGLAAAWWLATHNFDVHLFEASPRLGGRVWTVADSGTKRVVERGAELIGRNHATWLGLARQFRLPLSAVTDDEIYGSLDLHSPLLIRGKPRNADHVFKQLDAALTHLNRDAAHVNPLQPWDAARADEWDRRTVADWIAEVGTTWLCEDVLRFQLENMQGVPVERQSYLGLLAAVSSGLDRTRHRRLEPSAYWTDSEVFRCAGGNEALATALAAATTAAGGRITCDAPVQHIRHDPRRVTLKVKRRRNEGFDWVVLASPPTTWPRCTPALHASLKTGLGAAAKYEITVRRRFWMQDGLAPNGSSDAIGLLWEGTDNQNLPPGAPAQLTLFLGGGPALAASRNADPSRYCNDALAPLYPNLRTNRISARFINWPRKRWVKGGYSCPAPGDVCGRVKRLNDGIHRIVFAGEHTAMPFFGYMEGALYSGIRAARQIAAETPHGS
jgi:monoamine oxidase